MITRLKLKIDQRGIKQAWLALHTDIPERRLSEYVTGRRRPAYPDARKLAEILEVQIECLYPEFKDEQTATR